MALHYGQEIFEGLKAYRQPDGSIATFRPDANAAPLRALGAPAGHGRAAGGAVRRVAARARRRRRRVGADRPGRLAVLPSVHDRDRGRPRRASRPSSYTYLLIASPAGAVLRRRRQAGVGVAVDRVHPRRAGRHRRGQVRRQLRGLARRPGAGRRAGLRPGRLARRGRAPLGRGDGRHEPVLRLRLGRRRPHRHPGADRHAAARRHPRLAAHARRATSATPPRRARSRPTSGARATRPARSPRCSRAARPR